jgi:hypothetical protein
MTLAEKYENRNQSLPPIGKQKPPEPGKGITPKDFEEAPVFFYLREIPFNVTRKEAYGIMGQLIMALQYLDEYRIDGTAKTIPDTKGGK